jgi:hypothetical protein
MSARGQNAKNCIEHILSALPQLATEERTSVDGSNAPQVAICLRAPGYPIEPSLRPSASRSFLSRECLQIVAHDRASRRAASDFLEASARKRRGCANENIRRALRCARVDRISLDRRCPRTLCGLHGRGDELSHDPLSATVPMHEETGNGPDGQIVHTLEPPHVVKPRECIARRELAPAYWQIPVEREQTRRGTALHDLS